MDRRKKLIVGGALAVVVLAAGAGVGLATAGDDDKPLQGTDRDRAIEAALEETGGGKVLETEAGDDGAAYSVEIQKDDGSVVEVNLDADFEVTGTERDDDSGEAEDDD